MKTTASIVLGMLLVVNAWAVDIDMGADYYITPNPQFNTHEDGWGGHIRLSDPLYKDIYWFLEGGAITDIRYTSGSDDLGELRSYYGLGGLMFKPKTPWAIKPYILAGAGPGYFDWKESPFLQSEGIVIETEISLVTKVVAGLSYKAGDNWTFNVESGWWQSRVSVSCDDDGVPCRLPDDSPTGVEFIPISISGRYKF